MALSMRLRAYAKKEGSFCPLYIHICAMRIREANPGSLFEQLVSRTALHDTSAAGQSDSAIPVTTA